MLRIAKNFTLEELIATDTGISNVPDLREVVNLCYGVHNILQPMRDSLGIPIIINSGFRCQRVNDKVGGVWNSQHLLGQAVDIKVTHETRDAIWNYLAKCKFVDQCLGGKNYVHVSWSPFGTPRQYYSINYYK